MGTRAYIAISNRTDTLITATQVQFDGDRLFDMLANHYDTEDKANLLVQGGAYSSIGKTFQENIISRACVDSEGAIIQGSDIETIVKDLDEILGDVATGRHDISHAYIFDVVGEEWTYYWSTDLDKED